MESKVQRIRKEAAVIAGRAVDVARKAIDDLSRQSESKPEPSPVSSGRIRERRLEDYARRVDDSKLYRNPAVRNPEDQPAERILVRTAGESVSLRGRGQGSIPDRYLTIVAEVPDLPQKQGLSGTVTAGGLPQVENKQQLKPLLARGLTYDQGEYERMARSNPVVRNAVRATVERIAQGSEYYATPDVDFEALVSNAVDPEMRKRIAQTMREETDRAAEVLNLEWFHNPDIDSQQILREQSYAMVPGFTLHEFGIDPRLQGRRRTTFIEHRSQSSVLRWIWDERERWRGVVQNASGSPGLLADIPVSGISVQGMPVIDSRKLLLTSNQRIGLNLEGVSDLRAAWYASQGKTEWFVSALMHRRKWGNGFPLFRMDTESARSKAVSDSIKKAAEDFFYNGQAFVSLPAGVTMEMLEFDSDTGFIVAMEYFDKELLRSLGSLATEIGQNGGSYNLADVQQQERLRQLQGYVSQIKASRRNWIEAACATLVGNLGVLPELRIDGIMTRSDSEVLTVWQGVADVRRQLKPDGTPMYSENDIRTLCDTVGVPFTDIVEEQKTEQDAKPAPLLVGALQVAQQVLGSLSVSETNPNPIAPEAAVLLLSSAGVPIDVAREMVEAQIGRKLTPSASDNASAISAMPVSQEVIEATTETVDPKSSLEIPDASLTMDDDGVVSAFSRNALKAKTLDSVDTKPPVGVAKVAARALEWRKEYGRGGTEVGVARARDLANRKALSEKTIRRMKAYFDRHEVDAKADGWNTGEDKFPSAGRIAWDLWGGDPGRSWANKKVAEFNRIREFAKAMNIRTSAKRPDVLIRGRDQKPFVTHRNLIGREHNVSWASLYAAIDRESEALSVIASKIAEKARSQYVKRIKDAIISGDVKAIAESSLSMYDELLPVIHDFLEAWSQSNRKELISEIRSQAGRNWKSKIEAETFPAELSEIVETQAKALAEAFDADWSKRLKDSALSEASGLRNIESIRNIEPPVASWQKQSTSSTTKVANLTREEIARIEGPAIKSAQYSAIMDKLTCDNCKALDGQTFAFGSAQYLRNRPPLYNCKSTLGPYGNVCRCIYVYEFEGSVEGFSGPGFVTGD